MAGLEDPRQGAGGYHGAAHQDIGRGEVVQEQLLRAAVAGQGGVGDRDGHVPPRAGESFREGQVADVECDGALEGGFIQNALVQEETHDGEAPEGEEPLDSLLLHLPAAL